MDDAAVGLADAIAALRKELTAALSVGADEQVQFRLGPVELEVLLEIKRERAAQGGIRFWVVSLEGKGQEARASKHRIKLSLQPVSPGGTDLRVASDEPSRPP